MRRVFASALATAAATAVAGMAGCAGGGAKAVSPRAFQRPAASELPGAAGPAPVAVVAAEPLPMPSLVSAAADEPVDAAAPAAARQADEASLRRELATAADPTEAALALAAAMAADEQFAEALAVLDTALARHRTTLLRIARAGVLRDLGQRHLAKDELRTLRGEVGAAGLSPGLLFELAEIEWLEGEPAAATATLRQIPAVHADEPWVGAHRREVEALAAEVQRGGRPTRLRARDLLGNLRGAPLATDRIEALEQLCRVEPAANDARLQLRVRAIAVALGDDAGPVRARALQLAPAELPGAAALAEAALADADALVRGVAAARAAAWLGGRASPVLLAALTRETDPGAFVAEHQALAALVGIADTIDRDAVRTAAARSEVVARWRARTLP